uniref:Uncharacterized protein n=1 Tax=Romanomermis culicivorax TaxID=13658 RepID=A0A915L1L0_ROMCU
MDESTSIKAAKNRVSLYGTRRDSAAAAGRRNHSASLTSTLLTCKWWQWVAIHVDDGQMGRNKNMATIK